MKYEVHGRTKSLPVNFRMESKALVMSTDTEDFIFEAVKVQPGVYSVLVNNRSFVVGIGPNEKNLVHVNGTPIQLELLDAVHLHLRELGWDTHQEQKEGMIKAQIPGLITKIYHAIDDVVSKGDPIFLIEAMKMENEIKSPIDGVVKNIGVIEGQTVEKGTIIIEIV